MTMSNFFEEEVLKLLKGKENYVQLHTGDPGENCTSNVSATTTRKKVEFNEPSSGSMSSKTAQLWTGITATEKIKYISLWSAAAAGNAHWSGPLEAEKEVIEGENAELAAGDVIVGAD